MRDVGHSPVRSSGFGARQLPSCTDRNWASRRNGANSAASVPVSQAWLSSRSELVEQCRAPARIEMRGDLVEQQQRRLAAHRRAAAAHGPAGSRSAAPSARRSRHASAAMPLLGHADGEVGAMRPDRGAAGLGIALPIAGERRGELAPRRRAPASSSSQASTVPARPAGRAGTGLRPRRRRGRAAATASRRAAATATPCSAMVSSSAVEPRRVGSGRRAAAARARAAPAHRRATRAACAGSSPSTSRSRKRRRAAGPSTNSRSICGVSQTTPRCSPSAAWLRAGSPSIRTTRRSPAARGVAAGADAHRCRGGSRRRGDSPAAGRVILPRPAADDRSRPSLAPRSPRPGARNDTASSRLVLPAPLGPVSTTGAVPTVEPRLAIIAEIGQHEPRHADALGRGAQGRGSACGLRPASRPPSHTRPYGVRFAP